jgi:hypothetical protein
LVGRFHVDTRFRAVGWFHVEVMSRAAARLHVDTRFRVVDWFHVEVKFCTIV